MSLQFTGKITEIQEPRVGATAKGEWANVEFEITESQPQNPSYPQIGKFDLFKNGEHIKFAKDFKTYYKIGDEVTVHFNLKKNTYVNKEGQNVGFYKTSAWKLEKTALGSASPQPVPSFEPEPISDVEYDLPF